MGVVVCAIGVGGDEMMVLASVGSGRTFLIGLDLTGLVEAGSLEEQQKAFRINIVNKKM